MNDNPLIIRQHMILLCGTLVFFSADLRPVAAETLLEQLQSEKAREKEEQVIVVEYGDKTPLVQIEKGCFQMGQRASEKTWLVKQRGQKAYEAHYADEEQHEVCIEDDFKVSQYEVTVGEFQAFVAATGYNTDAQRNAGGYTGCRSLQGGQWQWVKNRDWRRPGFKQQDDHPVVCVSQHDALAYARWLSKKTGKHYRLPTESEWEYAARSGTAQFRYWGNDKQNNQACRYANVHDETSKIRNKFSWPHYRCDDGVRFTATVGRYEPNSLGLYDMLGNVWEWTCSGYKTGKNGAELTCAGKDDPGDRVLRGGAWYVRPEVIRSADRFGKSRHYRGDITGFRLISVP